MHSEIPSDGSEYSKETNWNLHKCLRVTLGNLLVSR